MSHPNELTIMDHASQPGSEEVMASAGQRLQTLIPAATQVAQAFHARMAEQARQAQAVSEAEERQVAQRRDAEYKADQLVWRQVFEDRFWNNATPEKVARAWQACVPWAKADFPSAKVAAEHMRQEIKGRYGIEIDPVDTQSRDLLTLLAADAVSDVETEAASTGDEQPAGDRAPDTPDRLDSVSYRIRDRYNGNTVVAADVVHLAPDEGHGVAELVAAQRLLEYRQQLGLPDSAPDQFSIEVFSGSDPDSASGLLRLDEHAADQVHQWGTGIVRQARSDDVAQTTETGGTDQLAEALRWGRRQARDDLKAASAPEQAENLRTRLGHLMLRLQAVEADARGEDGAIVFDWEHLRSDLDQDWWQQTPAKEIAAVWDQVEGWAPGRVRDQARQHLRAGLRRESGEEIPDDITGEQVAELVADRAGRQALVPPAQDRPAAEETTGGALIAEDVGAQQDREAAVLYEQMIHSDEPYATEAAESAITVTCSYTAPPSDRLGQSAQQDNPQSPAYRVSRTQDQQQRTDPLSR